MTEPVLDRQIQAITHPDKSLWSYYLLKAVAIPPLFPILVLPLYFRYHTIRYKFSDDGISMSWGILFRREILLNYARIQDIHLKSNIIERWLGLARILVQTASGSHSAEMTIEGIKEFEALRDFLYARMRGVKDGQKHPTVSAQAVPSAAMAPADELAAALRDTVRELRAIRESLEKRERSPSGKHTMFEPLRRWVLDLLKVPPEPHPPIGDPASLRVFRAGRNYYRLRIAGWATAQFLALLAFLFWTAILIDIESQALGRHASHVESAPTTEVPTVPGPSAEPANEPADTEPTGRNWIERMADKIRAAAETVASGGQAKKPNAIGEWVAGYRQFFVELALQLPPWVFPLTWIVKIVSFVIYLVQIPFTYALRRLDFEMRWYMVTDRSLRLRHGVLNVSESTMSFANVQQVVVTHGPLQRLLGLGDVKVQSAGGGSSHDSHGSVSDDMHVGLFRHVTNAQEIRDLILNRLRRYRESGLGDPEEKSTAPETPTTSSSDAIAAARELLVEAKTLRAVLG